MHFSELLKKNEAYSLVTPAIVETTATLHNLQETPKPLSEEFLATISQWEYDLVETTQPQLGIGGAYAFYGKPLSPQQAFEYAKEVIGGDIQFANAGGFSRIYAIEGGFTPEEYLASECIVISDLVQRSLQPFGKDVPDLFLTGTSLPSVPSFHKKIAQAVGITNMERVPRAFVRACDSAGSALFALLCGEYDQLLLRLHPELHDPNSEPIVVTIAAWEDGWRLQNQGGDGTSAQLFSTGAGVVSLSYHPTNQKKSSLVQVLGMQTEVEEGVECLRYNSSTDDWTDEEKADIIPARYMKPTDNNMAVQMEPVQTALYFRDNVVKLLQAFVPELLALYPQHAGELSSIISVVAMHHPSKTMANAVRKAAVGARNKPGLGYQENQLPWLLENGNAPSVMMLAAFIEILEQNRWDTDKLLQLLSFGAGGTFTTQVVKSGRVGGIH